MTDEGFVSPDEAAASVGLHPHALGRRLRRAGVVMYTDPLDRRRRLVARGDVERFLRPTPARRPNREGPATAVIAA